MRTVIALCILLLGKVVQSQAPFPATCELIIWNYCALSNGGFSNDDCLNSYCNVGSCNPKCCSLPSKQEQVSCINKGAARGGGAGGGGAPPPSPPKNAQCDQMLGRIQGCVRQTPSFGQLAPTAQASCLCVGGLGQYDPAPFDDSASSCYEWAKVSYTAFATSLENVGVVGFCTSHSPPGASAGAVPSTTSGSSGSGGNLVAPTSGMITTPAPTASITGGAVTNTPSSSTKSSATPAVRTGAHVVWVSYAILLSLAVLNGRFLSG